MSSNYETERCRIHSGLTDRGLAYLPCQLASMSVKQNLTKTAQPVKIIQGVYLAVVGCPNRGSCSKDVLDCHPALLWADTCSKPSTRSLRAVGFNRTLDALSVFETTLAWQMLGGCAAQVSARFKGISGLILARTPTNTYGWFLESLKLYRVVG